MADSEYIVERPICCSVKTFLYTNIVWAVLSVGLLGLGVVGVVVEQGVLVVLPPEAYFVAIGIGTFGIIVVFMGVIGQKQSIELCFLLYILFVSIGLVAQTLAYCYLLLYANDVATISSLDNAAINAQAQFEKNLISYAKDEPAKWVKTQDKLNCCGIDFELGINKDPAELLVFESGKRCTKDPAEVAELKALREKAFAAGFNSDDGDFEEAKNSSLIGAGTGFFCKDRISIFMIGNTPVIAALLCLILVVQITALVSAARMYWVPEYLGGWQFDEGDLEEVAQRKGLALPPPVATGGSLANNMRNTAQRLSFRFKNAFTADPDVPEQDGILKRLSMRRNPGMFGQPGLEANGAIGTKLVSSGNLGPSEPAFGQPNPAFAPKSPTSGPPPGMLSRFSNRLSNRLQPFGGAIFSFPKQPSGPPPGFGGPSQPSSPPPPGMPQLQNYDSARSMPSAGTSMSPAPRQPINPPPGSGMPGVQSYNSQRSQPKRISSRLQQGLKGMGAGMGFGFGGNGGPPPGPPPPTQQSSFGASPSQRGFGTSGGGASSNGLPKPNAGLGNMGGPPVGPPPPNTFRKQSGQGSSNNLGLESAGFGGGKNNSSGFNLARGSAAPSKSVPKKSSAMGMGGFGFGNRKTNAGGGAKPVKSAAPASAPAARPAPAGDRGGLLAQIQMGTRLKATVTNDRSAPII